MDSDKLKALVLYICDKVGDPSKLGSTKLNKILFYSDFIHYRKTGESITGEKYVKQKHGPVPYDILKVEGELIRAEKLVKKSKDHFGYLQNQYFSLEEADLNLFTAEEISLVDEIMDIITEHSATDVSNFSHDHIWESAEIGQEIPYEASFVAELGEVTTEDKEWALSIIREREAEKESG